MVAKALKPRLRFSGFTDAWEKRQFEGFVSKTGSKNKDNLDYPAYSVSNQLGLVLQSEQFEGSRLDNLDKSSYKFVKPNEFAYNPARINVGSIAFNNLGIDVLVSSLYVVLRLNEELNNDFILHFIKSPGFLKEVNKNTEGSVREYLFYENFKNIKFPYVRNIDEQTAIGTFFSQLDRAIALQEKKLENMKTTKKTLLKLMFV